MKFEIGAMSVGDILDRGLKLLWARFGTFYAITFLMLLPVLVVRLLTPDLVFPNFPQPSERMTEEQAARLLEAMLIWMGQALAVLFLEVILTLLATAVTLHITAGEYVDRHVGMGEAFGHVLRRLGSLLLTSILAWLVIGLGFFLCLVPGLIFLTWYVFVPQVVVLEGLSGPRALARSTELSAGFRWRIFGMFLLLALIQVGVGMVGSLVAQILPPAEAVPGPGGTVTLIINQTNYLLFIGISYLVGTVGHSYGTVCWTLFYFDLRIRKEGFDLEMAARQQRRRGDEPPLEPEAGPPPGREAEPPPQSDWGPPSGPDAGPPP